MTGVVVATLLALAGTVLVLPTTGRSGRRAPGTTTRPARTGSTPVEAGVSRPDRLWRSRRPAVDLHELPLFVHQLAGLLRAGRPPHVLWADIEAVYADGSSTFAAAVRPMIATARRAADLGLGVPDALRQGAAHPSNGAGVSSSAAHVDRLWIDLAGCFEVAGRSGAPLAKILEHYAAQLDAHLDGLSARDTALAGPRATVVLLSWLPAVGLVLGFALGTNPLEVLTASPPGRLALVAGAVLMIASRMWSRWLVQRAGGGSP